MKTTYVGFTRLATISVISLAAIAHVGAASQPATLVEDVRRATSRFQDVAAAQAAGYAPFLGCVSGPSEGAMGIHYVNGGLVGDGALNAQQPEALLYEDNDGALQLLGVEYIVLADAWEWSTVAGIAQYVIDPTDPFPEGFTVGDLWA